MRSLRSSKLRIQSFTLAFVLLAHTLVTPFAASAQARAPAAAPAPKPAPAAAKDAAAKDAAAATAEVAAEESANQADLDTYEPMEVVIDDGTGDEGGGAATGVPAVAARATPGKRAFVESETTRLGAQSLFGGVGVYRTLAAERGAPWTLRFGVKGEINRFDNQLVRLADGSAPENDNFRGVGRVGFSFTTVEWVEIYGVWASYSNLNSITSPSLLLNMSRTRLGAKGGYRVLPYLDVAGTVAVDLNAAPGAVAWDASSLGWNFSALLTWDASKTPGLERVPMKLHLNLGGVFIDGGAFGGRDFSNVEQFGLDINQNSGFQLAFAAEFPLPWVTPQLEFFMQEPKGLLVISPGIRIHPFVERAIYLELAGEIGLRRIIYDGYPAVPPWNVLFGVGFAFDLTGQGGVRAPAGGGLLGQVVDADTGEPIGNAIVALRPAIEQGYATSPDTGRFRIDFVPAGNAEVVVEREGYEPQSAEIVIAEGDAAEVTIALKRIDKPAEGTLSVRVMGDNGAAVAATVAYAPVELASTPAAAPATKAAPAPASAPAPATAPATAARAAPAPAPTPATAPASVAASATQKAASTNPSASGAATSGAATSIKADERTGIATARVAPGLYNVTVTVSGLAPIRREVAIDEGGIAALDLVVAAPVAPKTTLAIGGAALEWGRIALSRKVEFGVDDTLTRNSTSLVENIVALVRANPTIQRIVVEAHTDSTGATEDQLRRTTARAESVRKALVAQGLSAALVDAQGLGSAQPIASNRTTAGREANNRVEIVVVETASSK